MPSYTNLILRTLTSPYGDITRGGVLSWNDVDQNFLYLKGESIYDAVSSGGTITLKKYNGNDISFSGGSVPTIDVYVTGGTFNTGIATFTNNTGGTFSVTGFASTDTFVTGFTYSNNNLTLLRNQGLSDLNVVIDIMSGLTVNGSLSATTIFGDGNGLTNIDISSINNLQTSLDNKFDKSGGTISGLTTVYGDTPTSAAINPGVNNTYDLGSPSFRWREIYTTNIDTSNVISTYSLYSTYNIGVGNDLTVSGDTILQSTSATTLNLTNIPTQNNSATDILVRNTSTGDVEFISVSAITPDTNTYITGYTYNDANTFTITQNDNTSFYTTINNVTGLTVNGSLSATTIFGDGNGLTNINISSVNNLQTSLDSKIDEPLNPLFDEYLYYNGSAWVSNKLIIPVSAGAGVTLFLESSGSTLMGYELLSPIPTLSAETIESAITNNNIVYIDQYATEPLGRTKIDGGIWEYNTFASVDVVSTGITNIIISTYLRTSGGSETLLFSAVTTNITTTAATLYSTSNVELQYNCNESDRLVVRYSATTTNNINTTVSLYHGGSINYSHIHTPFDTQHNDLSGLQGGSSNNYYHLELSQLNLLTTGVDASSIHNHYNTVLGLSGGTVTGTTNFTNGINTNTISATTYQNLPLDIYVTGGTYNAGTTTFTNNNNVSFNVTGFTSTDTFTTGFTYSNNNLIIKQNQGLSDLTVNVNTMTGLTINGTLSSTTIYSNSIGIKTTTPSFDLEVNGTFGATSKSFVIKHPTQEGKKLVYGAIEGPEFGVYVRGKVNGNIIELPEEWVGLVDESTITVQLTGDGLLKLLYVKEIKNNTVHISNMIPFITPTGYYTVYGERKDIDKLKTII